MESARVATVEEFTHAVIQITRTTTIRNGKEWTPYEQIREMLTTRDAAIRAECAGKAVRYVFFDGDDPEAFPNAPPISSTGLRAVIMGDKNE